MMERNREGIYQCSPVVNNTANCYNGGSGDMQDSENTARDTAEKGVPLLCHTTSEDEARLSYILFCAKDKEKAVEVAVKVILDFLEQSQSCSQLGLDCQGELDEKVL